MPGTAFPKQRVTSRSEGEVTCSSSARCDLKIEPLIKSHFSRSRHQCCRRFGPPTQRAFPNNGQRNALFKEVSGSCTFTFFFFLRTSCDESQLFLFRSTNTNESESEPSGTVRFIVPHRKRRREFASPVAFQSGSLTSPRRAFMLTHGSVCVQVKQTNCPPGGINEVI